MIKFNTQDVFHIALSRTGYKIVDKVPEKGVCFSFRPITNREYARYNEAFYSVKGSNSLENKRKWLKKRLILITWDNLIRQLQNGKN